MRLPRNAVNPANTSVYMAVEAGHRTVRDIALATGQGVAQVHARLNVLRSAGFVDWEPGKHATIRPTLRRVA